MKKMILGLSMILTIGSSAAFANGFDISRKVLDAFNSEFAGAQEITWTEGSDYYKAEFSIYGQRAFAYYSFDGELVGITRYIDVNHLPLTQFINLKNDYAGYWIADLFEVSKKDGTHYYVTIENANSILMLQSSGSGKWINYQKKNKG